MLLPVLTKHLDDMGIDHKVIECIRNPWTIAKSLAKSAGVDVNWLPYVQEHINQKGKNLSRYEGSKLILTFDEIFKEDAIDCIAQFVGKEVTTEAREWIGKS